MKLEVGMYVRTKEGSIAKVLGFDIFEEGKGTNIENLEAVYFDKMLNNIDKDIYSGCFNEVFKNAKSSHDIIDLIEVGDYVNGKPVAEIDEDFKMIFLDDNDKGWRTIVENDNIKTILTKECFENNCFKIGD